MRVVYVEWRDSEASNSWSPIDDIKDELELTLSVGFLIKEAEAYYLVALSYDPDTESINNHKKIPRSAVEKIRTICHIKTTKKTKK